MSFKSNNYSAVIQIEIAVATLLLLLHEQTNWLLHLCCCSDCFSSRTCHCQCIRIGVSKSSSAVHQLALSLPFSQQAMSMTARQKCHQLQLCTRVSLSHLMPASFGVSCLRLHWIVSLQCSHSVLSNDLIITIIRSCADWCWHWRRAVRSSIDTLLAVLPPVCLQLSFFSHQTTNRSIHHAL